MTEITQARSLSQRPQIRPKNPRFSSGPCSKRPGFDVSALDLATLGRSHRSALGKSVLQSACEQTAELLGLPADYRVGIVPASDTGAMEMAMWSLLGARPVDVFSWESFGKGWLVDIEQQLKLDNARSFTADYGMLPDLDAADPEHDIVFTWNGTTSGVCVPDGAWISDDRHGLTICDATSAVFAMPLPWHKLDVVTYSWQKVLGGEGAHGMLILGPRAVARLESHTPPWPLPKIFRLTKNGRLNEGIFKGSTINTPSMLCVADYLDSLDWIRSIGGQAAAIGRSRANLALIESFVNTHGWIDFLAQDPATRSSTSVCLTLDLPDSSVKRLVGLLAQHEAAYDIGAYRDAPAGLRIWCGATVEAEDIKLLMPWIEWAYHEVKEH
ncbi:MAG: phosphoserine transaminase [Xanthomonadales bacterium]|nr:phosphoserine transaminase [Gammaproteobacteria bacterium]NNL95835.1 phosphoserine transaminase [Xanthomonadales bacterium]